MPTLVNALVVVMVVVMMPCSWSHSSAFVVMVLGLGRLLLLEELRIELHRVVEIEPADVEHLVEGDVAVRRAVNLARALMRAAGARGHPKQRRPQIVTC